MFGASHGGVSPCPSTSSADDFTDNDARCRLASERECLSDNRPSGGYKTAARNGSSQRRGSHIDRPQFAVCLRAGGWTIRCEFEIRPNCSGVASARTPPAVGRRRNAGGALHLSTVQESEVAVGFGLTSTTVITRWMLSPRLTRIAVLPRLHEIARSATHSHHTA